MNFEKSPAQCALLLELISGRGWKEVSDDAQSAYGSDAEFILFREDNRCMVYRRPHSKMEHGVDWAITRSSDLFDFTGDNLLAMLADKDVRSYISDDTNHTKSGHDSRKAAVHFFSPTWEFIWPFAHKQRALELAQPKKSWWQKFFS